MDVRTISLSDIVAFFAVFPDIGAPVLGLATVYEVP